MSNYDFERKGRCGIMNIQSVAVLGAGAVGSYVIWGLSLIQEVVEWN